MTWLLTVGDWEEGDMVIKKIGICISYPPGSIMGMMGWELEHYTILWKGQERFCLVHTFYEFACQYAIQEMK